MGGGAGGALSAGRFRRGRVPGARGGVVCGQIPADFSVIVLLLSYCLIVGQFVLVCDWWLVGGEGGGGDVLLVRGFAFRGFGRFFLPAAGHQVQAGTRRAPCGGACVLACLLAGTKCRPLLLI